MNYFEGIPSPIGAILILLPLIYEISDFRKLVSVLLISKIPTFSFKKISIPSKLTIFILLFTGLSFISLMFFTFETLLVFCFLYILTLPVSIYLFKKNKNNFKDNTFDEDHEDIL